MVFCGLWDKSSAILAAGLVKGTFYRLLDNLRNIVDARLNKGRFFIIAGPN